MIRLAWRQFRVQAAVTTVMLAVSAAVLAVAGVHLARLYRASGIANCRTRGGCSSLTAAFLQRTNGSLGNHLPLLFGTALVAAPAVIGVLWGAPLLTRGPARDVPPDLAGNPAPRTLKLPANPAARIRWLAARLAVAGLASVAAAGLFSLMVTWSASRIDQANMNRLAPSVFSQRGVVPVGYAAFALALGVAAGALVRRTLPAMALTLAAFTAVQFAMRAIRSHLIAPVRLTSAITAVSSASIRVRPAGAATMSLTAPVHLPGAWVLSTQTVNATGNAVGSVPLSATGPLSAGSCQGGAGGPAPACLTQLGRLGYRQLVTYQPASRFWAFQWQETAIFLALALGLAGLCFWWVRRRAA